MKIILDSFSRKVELNLDIEMDPYYNSNYIFYTIKEQIKDLINEHERSMISIQYMDTDGNTKYIYLSGLYRDARKNLEKIKSNYSNVIFTIIISELSNHEYNLLKLYNTNRYLLNCDYFPTCDKYISDYYDMKDKITNYIISNYVLISNRYLMILLNSIDVELVFCDNSLLSDKTFVMSIIERNYSILCTGDLDYYLIH